MNNIAKLLKPTSVAVIGASNTPFRAGKVVMTNLLEGGFQGAIMPVSPKYKAVCGVLAYPDINSLPIVPDVAVLCTHASRNKQIFEQLAEKKVSTAIVLSSDMHTPVEGSKTIEEECIEIAKKNGIRVLGSNSLGIILPWKNFNASFSPVSAAQGNIAFISQSAAVCTTVLDWANDKGIGFSSFISIGNGSDIDVAELLDHLCTDSKTNAILLYIDSIKDARRFMSAARAASRNRRILVLKGGKTYAGRQAAIRHTGGTDTLDIIYDSAIRRTGMLRVNNTHELFAAVETLTHSVPLRGERLGIITNGGGPSIMAVDTLLQWGGKLADLSDNTITMLDAKLPSSWSRSNPVDMIGDADKKRYVDTINTMLDSDDIDALLIMHSPSAIAHSTETAEAVIECVKKHPRHKRFNILTNWTGEKTTREARLLFTQAGIPTYRTPESAVVAYMHLVEYRRNQKHLMETPTTSEQVDQASVKQARDWVIEQTTQSEVTLDTHQISPLLKYYKFTVLDTWIAQEPAEAVQIADQISYPVAVKLRSPDIAHKSDVNGVVLNLRNPVEVQSAAQSILDGVQLNYPSASVQGLIVQAMASRIGAYELRVKVKSDEIFGPVILLGEGGSDWDESIDAAAAMLPLNMALARYLIIRAIKGNKIRSQKAMNINIDDLCEFLVRLSQMVVDNPQIHELDIHPLLAVEGSLTILDADLKLRHYQGEANDKLAIRPYPVELEESIKVKSGEDILIRPILPEDEPEHATFLSNVSKDDLYKRFFSDVGEFNHEALANLTQIDFDREIAFVAIDMQGNILGESRALIDPENIDAEFAILIRSDRKGCGLGRILMERIIRYCKNKGTRQMSGMTMPTNRGMLTLAQKLGFEIDVQFADGTADMLLPLD
ncbi:bifunctional acetate--CoA ligase family protein/GNAT family N-acetyltransferase [Vibrio sp. SCSIO 43137]|uniref:bifunctional acetate--CoA ligase family protein/GNAT family N-acetyltransferase n=1 Tax=Vibrio sp. SCSIO 43137 TaxID=3021011 RepID=UPI00230766A4|nr:bifunctional acetate--CoA ligase family protein/GNAT family N-acetyltransferase [Vibrio sp. SCSIO 43137]WCE32632.1 bifunctional acetate--CoA ligase family protein/GNAT family N-acetyltransferase [Vibrio sp. SCSIO 43137]